MEVEEITTEVLDQLLAELMNNGCENKLKTDKNKEQGESRPQSRKETAEKRPQSRSDKVSLVRNYNILSLKYFIASVSGIL